MNGQRFVVSLTFFFVAAIAFAAGSSEGDGQEGEQIDYLGVAGIMIRDGNYDRARSALENVDPTDEGVDLSRYFTLTGLVELRQGNYREAADAFELALSSGEDDPLLLVYLSQAYYASQEYEQALETVDRIQNRNQYPDLYSIMAESHWRLGNRQDAYEIISRAIELFPSRTQFLRQRIFYLVELDLTQEAADQGLEYVRSLENEPDAYVTVGEALRRGGNPAPAIRTLEMGRMRFPANERILLSLAQAYLDAGHPRSAGDMVAQAAAGNPQLYFEAAEIFRRAGEYTRALFLNSQVAEEEQKAVQRFNILMSMGLFEEALALEPRLEAIGATSDDNVAYAIAYAFFETRQLEEAAAYTSRVESPEFFRQATQLRRAIETLRESEFEPTGEGSEG